ncbi:GRIP domain containing protein [Leishmania braziliensis]|nr:GRIP domain containing protein [Leishmania braziliensis]
MRAQIVDLTRKLDESNEQRALLEASLGNREALPELYLAQCQEFMYAHAIAAASMMVDATSLSHNGGKPEQCKDVSTTDSAMTSPSRDTVIENLQKAIKDQSNRLKEVQYALKRSTNELQQRTEALRQQDESLAEMKHRLTELETSNTSLRQQLLNAPNTDEWKQAQEDLDQQLERTRLEYEIRESQLVLQYSAELQALKASHEREVHEMQREHRDAIAETLRAAQVSSAQATVCNSVHPPGASDVPHHGTYPGKTDDDAYLNLLSDYKAMERQCATAMKERGAMVAQQKALLRELKDILHSAVGPLPASDTSNTSVTATTSADETQATAGWNSVTDIHNLKEAVRQIHEQSLRFAGLQEELMRTRREVMQLRRSTTGPSEDGLGAQQLQYVRSVVVRLFCSLSDVHVARHLLPVLSTLLKFTDEDLKAITKAML